VECQGPTEVTVRHQPKHRQASAEVDTRQPGTSYDVECVGNAMGVHRCGTRTGVPSHLGLA
jgi:hypothetical protein